MWYGLVDANGALVSVGTVAMFAGGDPANAPRGLTVHAFGEDRPDFGAARWNPATRAMEARPAPVLIDRLDDIEAWLMADEDFASVWATLSAARRTAIRRGIRAVLARVAGARRYRRETEAAELD